MRLIVIVLALLMNIIFVDSAGAVELPYTYENLTNDVTELSKLENVEVFSIGQSEYGRELYAVKIGKGELNTVIVGTAHAREWMNSVLTIEMAKAYADAYNNYGYIGWYNVRELLDWCSITFIPMQNPDGVALQQQGLAAFTPEQQEEIKKLGNSMYYKKWKANARGVDLNRQQNINWYSDRTNVPYPSYQNHKGWAPEQAMETTALLKHIREVKPKALISYHSAGQIVDWKEFNRDINRDYNLAKKVSDATGYSFASGSAIPVAGCLSPWFRYEIGGMALTIETGRFNGENEVRYSDWGDIWEKNKTVGLVVANEVYINWWNSWEKQAKIDELEQRVSDYQLTLPN
jgi:g-D-glutamyl-meso-diaminopimelate peptidase